MKEEIKSWRDVWKPPFYNWHNIYGKAGGVMAFNFLFSDKGQQDKLIDILNEVQESEAKHPVTAKEGKVYLGDRAILLIRGWGHLTGHGALQLDSEFAAKLQDDLTEFIVSRLTPTL